MPLKTSLLNKEMSIQIFRSTGWISVIYFIGLLFAVPLAMLMMYSDADNINQYREVKSLFYYQFPIQAVLLVAVPILMAVFLFRYLHVKQAADMMHSLPVKRETIYHHYALTGLVFLILPVVFISLIILVIHTALDLNSFFTLKDIVYWAGVTILINLLLYTAGVFIGMMTGISVVQAVLSYIFLLFPLGIIVLILLNVKFLFYGFPSDYYLNNEIEKMSPISYAFVLDAKHFEWSMMLIYAIFSLLLYGLALFFYKKRNTEAASEAIAFIKMRSIFKYGMTFCMMLAGGMYFGLVPYSSFGWILFGYGIGSIFGYYIAEMLFQKTWRVFTQFKGLAMYFAAIILIVTLTRVLGVYGDKVPAQNEVKSVLLSDSSNVFVSDMYEKYLIPKPLKEKNSIEAVRKLHLRIIKEQKVNQARQNEEYRVAFLKYQLKDGGQVIREYRIKRGLYEDLYKPIYESTEYKRSTNPIFKVEEKKVKAFTIMANGQVFKRVTISKKEDIKKAVGLLREDILAESYEDSTYYQNRVSSIEMNMGGDQIINTEMKPSYLKTTKWLKEKGWLDQSKITSDDIDYVLVAKNQFGDIEDSMRISKEVEKLPDTLKVTDSDKVEYCLDHTSVRSGSYVAVFNYKGSNYPEVLYFDDEHAPNFIKKHFK
ncbi:DUF6449 domain-containing protein [Neobacillus sp. PS3-34]|uniref:DUF6449 domain-containing protein n=1 Tax=Neobacillus sp. PS3-34 TaxID=3070678 RepID=UPI0027E158E6|nr:DUF6449 domain-containing protein [Neobacillus sp. PS3-34]WML50065.1 DUF6449 domain-containing protein [Neobacillus sp. PS3-34]